jgi:hypothetical protein
MMNPKVIINFILFQITWFACVIGGAERLPWLGILFALVTLTWHFYIATDKLVELKLVTCVIVIGGLFDQFLLSSHLVSYQSHGWSNNLVPVWILGLWIGFTTTLNVSFRWMHRKWLVSAIFGLIGGPLAYIGAAKLGAVTLNSIPQTYIALAIGWGVLTPSLIKLAQHYDGFKPLEISS